MLCRGRVKVGVELSCGHGTFSGLYLDREQVHPRFVMASVPASSPRSWVWFVSESTASSRGRSGTIEAPKIGAQKCERRSCGRRSSVTARAYQRSDHAEIYTRVGPPPPPLRSVERCTRAQVFRAGVGRGHRSACGWGLNWIGVPSMRRRRGRGLRGCPGTSNRMASGGLRPPACGMRPRGCDRRRRS